MPSYNQLDFQLLPSLESAPIFVSLDPVLEENMASLPETWARADAALRFCWYISQGTERLHADEPRATRLREAFLRACLTEYRSMEEVLPRDLDAIAINTPALKIHQIENPLVHLMKEVRNFEIHLASSALTPNKIKVIVRWQNEELEHESTIWVTEPLTVQKFNGLDNARYYSATDIKAMVDWFNDAQQEWGVHHLAFLAVKTYCEELVTYYELQSTQGT